MDDRDDGAATLDASHGDVASGPRVIGTDLLAGQVFAGRYDVEALIGRGGMGTVWRVRDRMVGETVALKTLSFVGGPGPDGNMPEGDARALERFRREVRLARRITSQHVARTHDLGTHAGLHYLTMEYVEGASLGRVIEQEGTLSPERTAKIGAEIADGLAAAHGAGVVHRDLKPDNVLVESKTRRVVVTDFGIARALDQDAANRTGGIVGTPLYMAPEQVAGSTVDARSDIYALGLVMFEMLTGVAAFAAATPIAAAVKRLHQPARDPRELASVPDALAEIVLRCLAREPSARFSDAATLARVLHGFGGAGALSIDLSALVAQGGSPSIASAPAPSALSTPSTSTPTSGARPPVAPLLKHDPALAVVPFTYRGPADQDWLAGGIRDELIDVLSRTRGLRVLGRGAAERAKDERDPRAIGTTLGVDFVVDATVQLVGPRVRVTARLLDVATGTQLWSERFDAEVEDLFVLQERIGQRIAESLRLGMHAVGHAVPVPPEALELYLRARRAARGGMTVQPAEIVEMLERVIAQAPDFGAAHAAHAMACVRSSFVPQSAGARSWRLEAETSIARAMERAPDLAETHFARAQLMSQDGRYREAVQSARTALGIAPTLPEAHQFLASLQLEAGRAKEGLQRIDLVLGLEPTMPLALQEKARWHGFYGDLAVFDEVMRLFEQETGAEMLRGQILIRSGAFRGDREKIERGVELMSRSTSFAGPALVLYGRVMLGDISAGEAMRPIDTVLQGPLSGRFRSLLNQMASEAWGRTGDVEKTLAHFRAGADTVLLDLEWVDRCPFLEVIRSHPDFPELRRKVRVRCEQIWTA